MAHIELLGAQSAEQFVEAGGALKPLVAKMLVLIPQTLPSKMAVCAIFKIDVGFRRQRLGLQRVFWLASVFLDQPPGVDRRRTD